MYKILATFLIFSASAFLNGCVTSKRLDDQTAKQISFIRLEPTDSSQIHIQYQGPLAAVSQGVATAVPGVATGLAAGVGAVANDSYTSEIDRVAHQNQIFLDKFLLEDIKKTFQTAGFTVKDATEGGVVLRITAVNQLFQRFIGNPALMTAASFELYRPAVEGREEEVLWHYRSVVRNHKDFPDYSYDELLEPEKLRKLLMTASQLMARDTLQFLQEKPQ
ncbi:MAG TPA: hypothetical protein VE954_27605 [Oligoflexus sp.]|uniref:hypothetical protein n=1 Tax=Oligoflexus sp. TaxID=1971216 RepID=UPI002D48E78F|nr:hypothetical protein [Oligoflexus sp.]HYX36891.1 hypothetical protein [Oligoflexus sp.]